jgi:hypothetical protein
MGERPGKRPVRQHHADAGAESLAHFKESFGARALPYHGYRLERLPLTKVDRASRQLVKRMIRMRPP